MKRKRIKLHAVTQEPGVSTPVHVYPDTFYMVAASRIPGKLKDASGKPIFTDGTSINAGAGGMFTVTESIGKVFELTDKV